VLPELASKPLSRSDVDVPGHHNHRAQLRIPKRDAAQFNYDGTAVEPKDEQAEVLVHEVNSDGSVAGSSLRFNVQLVEFCAANGVSAADRRSTLKHALHPRVRPPRRNCGPSCRTSEFFLTRAVPHTRQ